MSIDNELLPRILEKSIRLFKEKGYEQVRVDEICEACHITKPTFYRFAGSKGDLVRLYYQQLISEMIEEWESIEVDNAWSYLMQQLSFFLALVMQNGVDLCKTLLLQDLISGDPIPSSLKRLSSGIKREVRKMKEQDVLACGYETEVIASTIILALSGAMCEWVSRNGTTDMISGFCDSVALYCQPRRWNDG